MFPGLMKHLLTFYPLLTNVTLMFTANTVKISKLCLWNEKLIPWKLFKRLNKSSCNILAGADDPVSQLFQTIKN